MNAMFRRRLVAVLTLASLAVPLGLGAQVVPPGNSGEHVRHAGDARRVADLGRRDLRVQAAAECHARHDEGVPEFPAELFRSLVKHGEHDLGSVAGRSLLGDVRLHLAVGEQPVGNVHVAARLDAGHVGGGEGSRVRAVPAVRQGDEVEGPDPAVDAHEVGGGAAEVEHRLPAGAQILRDLGERGELLIGHSPRLPQALGLDVPTPQRSSRPILPSRAAAADKTGRVEGGSRRCAVGGAWVTGVR